MVARDLSRFLLVGALLSVLSIATAGRAATTMRKWPRASARMGIFWSCQNFGSVLVRQNTTYYLTVDAASATYQQFDINITLTSLIGDADL